MNTQTITLPDGVIAELAAPSMVTDQARGEIGYNPAHPRLEAAESVHF
jgi:hypothetical protein